MATRVALAIRSKEKYEPYRRAVERAGLEAPMFEPGSGESFGDVAGLVLTGGTDVDPALYGAEAQPETEEPDRDRDLYELSLLRAALARDIPVLAICRGLQLFNVACGGTLIQHLPDTDRHRKRTGGQPIHDVAAEGRLAEILGAKRLGVNSRHHQAADRMGDGLVVVARDTDDGIIEGMVFPAARFGIAVQWHPEDMTEDEHQVRLFAAFAAAVEQR